MIEHISRSRLRVLSAGVTTVALIVSGCQKSATEVCTDQASISLFVTVRDSLSGALVPNASLRASMGAIRDSLAIGSNVGAYPVSLDWSGGAGTFDVAVNAPGYMAWTTSATVLVSDARCGRLAPLSITALLQKSP
jgi:hypothetical protein